MKPFHILVFVLLGGALGVTAQEEANQNPEDSDRVHYVLVLPEEKTAELVKEDETNPFESSSGAIADEKGNTEENRVRDIMLRLPVTGGVMGENGMRIMLGGMRLETGGKVPPVVADQQVELKVKSITPTTIELVWVEKKPGILPAKSLVIPIDGSPKVRYQLPASQGGGGMGAIRRENLSAFARPSVPSSAPAAAPAKPASAPVPAQPSRSQASVPAEADAKILRAVMMPQQPAQAAPQPVIEKAVVQEAKTKPEPAEVIVKAELPAAPVKAVAVPEEPNQKQRTEVARAAPAKSSPSVAGPIDPEPKPIAESSASQAAAASAPTASVWRMLFGNHAPAEK